MILSSSKWKNAFVDCLWEEKAIICSIDSPAIPDGYVKENRKRKQGVDELD